MNLTYIKVVDQFIISLMEVAQCNADSYKLDEHDYVSQRCQCLIGKLRRLHVVLMDRISWKQLAFSLVWKLSPRGEHQWVVSSFLFHISHNECCAFSSSIVCGWEVELLYLTSVQDYVYGTAVGIRAWFSNYVGTKVLVIVAYHPATKDT